MCVNMAGSHRGGHIYCLPVAATLLPNTCTVLLNDDGLLMMSVILTNPLLSLAIYVNLLKCTIATVDACKINNSINGIVFLLVLSEILPIAVVIFPGVTRPLNDEVILKIRLNVSVPSTMLSFKT